MSLFMKRALALMSAVALVAAGLNIPTKDALAEDTENALIETDEKPTEYSLHGYVNENKEFTSDEYFHIEDDNTVVKMTISSTAEDAGGVLKFTFKSATEDEAVSNDIAFSTKKMEETAEDGTVKTYGACTMYRKLVAGDYKVSISFDKTTTFDLVLTNCVSIISNQAEVVEGFSAKSNFVKSDYANIELKSADEKVATIDSNGKIVGVKAGTAGVTITGKDEDGNVLFSIPGQCKIKVKKNTYKSYKLTIEKAKKIDGAVALNVYTLNYDKKGNLVIKFTIANKYKKAIKRVNNVKIKVVNEKGKTVGVYSGTLDLTVKSGATKNINDTIKKKDLKIKKKVNLTTCKVKYLNNSKDMFTATPK